MSTPFKIVEGEKKKKKKKKIISAHNRTPTK